MGSRVRRGAHIRCKVTIRNFSKVLVNATAIDLLIIDSEDTTVETLDMTDLTHESTGVYYYSFKPAGDAPLGTYTADWDVTYSALHGKAKGFFEVIE